MMVAETIAMEAFSHWTGPSNLDRGQNRVEALECSHCGKEEIGIRDLAFIKR